MGETAASVIRFEDPERIVAALTSLRPGRHRITLTRAGNAPDSLAIAGFKLAPRGDRIEFTPADTDAALWAEASCRLEAVNDQESLVFTGLRLAPVADHEAPALTSTLPEALTVSDKRDAIRLAFRNGMRAGAYLRFEGAGEPLAARVLDLAVGGCRVETSVSAGVLLKVDQPVAEVRLLFPNREELSVAARVRHVRIAAGQAPTVRVGLAFAPTDSEQQQRLWLWLRDIERESALRDGARSSLGEPCKLFATTLNPVALPEPGARKLKLHDGGTAAALSVLRDVAGQLGRAVIALRRGQRLPAAALYDGARALVETLAEDRASLLYALCCLDDQPALTRHALAVAGRLADLARVEPGLGAKLDDIVVAALLHELGKTLLAQGGAQSLDTLVDEPPPARLRDHPHRLLEQIHAMRALGAVTRTGVIQEINERLDGTGYPTGLRGERLTALGRAAAVVDAIDIATRHRSHRSTRTAIQAYRELHGQRARFDRYWLKRYIQRHGAYPIGSLLRYERGFLAWVMRQDASGRPSRLRVVKHVTDARLSLGDVLEPVDFDQLGELGHEVRPESFGLCPY